jgi:predicted component of type VI protein secretion system
MAYVIVYHKDQEVVRRELSGMATIGRSPDCELSVHDIMLSRRHCRIEPDGEGWILADLDSKNGTRVGGNAITRAPLSDGDVIRMGKTAVRYRTGPFMPATKPHSPGVQRPADPFEALSGTVRDFSYQPVQVATNGIPFPVPRPIPREPEAYADQEVRSLVSELVSSSWDSIYEGASRSDPMMTHTHAAAERAVRRARPREPRVDLSLQVAPGSLDHLPEPPAFADRPDARPSGISKADPHPSRRLGRVVRRLAPIFQWLAVLPLLWGLS